MTDRSGWSLRLHDIGSLLSGYLYLMVAAAATLLLMPVYARLLGGTGWGDVALCLGVQGLLFGIDAVLGPLLLREVALARRGGTAAQAHRRFLRLYGGIAGVLFVIGQLALLALEYAAPANSDMLLWAGRLALVQFLFQFANLATIGTWHGQQRQSLANARLSIFLLLKHAAALLIVTQASATAVGYFVPFALIGALEFAMNVRRFRADVGASPMIAPAPDSAPRPPDAGAFPAYVVAAVLGLFVAHIDRLYFAVALPHAVYGHYFLLGVVLLSLLHLQMPVQRAFVPRIVAERDPQRAIAEMRRWMSGLLVLPTLLLALFADRVLQLWLGDPGMTAAGAAPLRLMLLAAACLALAGPNQAWLLRAGRYRAMAGLHLLSLLLQLGLLVGLTPAIGMLAGGWAWLAAGVVQLLGSSLLIRHASITVAAQRG